MKKISVYTAMVLLLLSGFVLHNCQDKGEIRYARYPLSLRQKPDKKAKRITWISKGEKVRLIEPMQGAFAKIRLAGGEEGYAESKHLALDVLVLTTEEIKLKRRPSESSGPSYTASNIRKGAVAFVQKSLSNEEGEWLKIIGGSGGKKADFPYFQGWIKKGYGYVNSPSIVQSAIELEKAMRKKDIEALRKLSNEPMPIAEVAAAKVVELEGVEEDKLEQDTEVAPQEEGEPATNATDANSNTNATQPEPATNTPPEAP